MMRNAMIIFTNRNELMDEDDPADQNVDAWIGKNPNLLKLMKNNKLKYLAFENKRSIEEEKDLQVKDLLSVVDDIDKKDVSWNRKMENKIYVDKKTMVETFGLTFSDLKVKEIKIIYLRKTLYMYIYILCIYIFGLVYSC
jgi:hypothetical protein